MLTEEPLPATKQKLEFCNKGNGSIEVMVEMIPNRYVLQPKDTLILVADAEDAPRNEGFTVNLYDGSVQIYAPWDGEPAAFINGQSVEPDWTTATSAVG